MSDSYLRVPFSKRRPYDYNVKYVSIRAFGKQTGKPIDLLINGFVRKGVRAH